MAASNIKPTDDALQLIDELYNKKKHNFIIFKITDDVKIEVEESQAAEGKDGEWDYAAFAAKLAAIHEPRYALVGLQWKRKDGCVMDKVVFIAWNPDGGKVRTKMLYGSSTEDFKVSLRCLLFSLFAAACLRRRPLTASLVTDRCQEPQGHPGERRVGPRPREHQGALQLNVKENASSPPSFLSFLSWPSTKRNKMPGAVL